MKKNVNEEKSRKCKSIIQKCRKNSASKNEISFFDICCGPSFGVSKMGSFVSQLQVVVEIRCDEVVPFARFLANLYRKSSGLSYFLSILFLLPDYHSLITFFIYNSFLASPFFKCLFQMPWDRIFLIIRWQTEKFGWAGDPPPSPFQG